MSTVPVLLIRLYQVTVGKLMPQRCRFHPSCSEFAIEAYRANGLVKGTLQAMWRVMRCGPWTAGGIQHARRLRPEPVRAAIRGLRHG